MAVLGLAIQSTTGIPLYIETWSEKLSGFREGNPILISGFLSAVSSFANNFKQNIYYFRLNPIDSVDHFGVDAVYSFIGTYMILCFVDPYQFHEYVDYKINWIYGKVLYKFEDEIRVGKVPTLTEDEHKFIHDILIDTFAWNMIYSKSEQLNAVCELIIEDEFPGDVSSIFITSFDNSILYSYGMDKKEVEIYLNNIGSGGHGLEDGEILHNYVSLPGIEPKLLVMTNSGVKVQISDILGDNIIGQGGVPFYYYMITDVNSAIGPMVDSLIGKFNSILL